VKFVPVHGCQRAASSKTQTGREGKHAGLPPSGPRIISDFSG
jgi:hypothetical protein